MGDYQLYGLRLRTDRPIPFLAAARASGPADVSITFSSAGDLTSDALGNWTTSAEWPGGGCSTVRQAARRDADSAHFRLRYQAEETIDFVADASGRQLSVAWTAAVTFEDVAVVLILQALPWLLQIRGVTCLHASAVTVGERAIVLVGASGTGKSTTAAALIHRAGGRALADDVAVLSEEPASAGRTAFLIEPGYPVLSLGPESAKMIQSTGGRRAFAHRPARADHKRYVESVDVDAAPPLQPVRLAAVYVFERRDPLSSTPSVEPLSGVAGLASVLSHIHLGPHSDPRARARAFQLLGRLAATVPVRRIRRPDGLERLAAICDAIVGDVRTVAADEVAAAVR